MLYKILSYCLCVERHLYGENLIKYKWLLTCLPSAEIYSTNLKILITLRKMFEIDDILIKFCLFLHVEDITDTRKK